jgi:superfamily II DNA or RNA helicase
LPTGCRDSKIKPRQWQQQLIQLLRRRLHDNTTDCHDVLVFAGPGAGKTLGALLAFRSMRDEAKLRHVLVLCHRTSILEQWRLAAERLGLQLSVWPEEAHKIGSSDGMLLTYQSAGRQQQRLIRELHNWGQGPCLAIADEAHHLGLNPDEPDAAVWGQTFQDISAGCRMRLGLTGTPFRADQLAFCAARRVRLLRNGETIEQIVPDLCVEPRDLINAGDVRPLEFRFQDGWVEHSRAGMPDRDVSPLSGEQRESWRARNLRRAVSLTDPSSIGQQVLIKAQRKLATLRDQHPRAAGLVIAKDIHHAESITQLLQEDGNRVDLVHSQDRDAASRLSCFQEGDADWLVSIDMCSEGFDAPRLRVIAYLTTVVTRSRFLQGITRAVRMTPELALAEPIPRHPSFVFAPADPRLIGFARNWSIAEPYVIQAQEDQTDDASSSLGRHNGPSLPLEAINDGAEGLIRLKTPQLPPFLQR